MDNKQTKEEIQQNLIDNLFWKSCIRNDKTVAQTLYASREIDSIYGLEETGFLDDFFHFLQVFNIWPSLTGGAIPSYHCRHAGAHASAFTLMA